MSRDVNVEDFELLNTASLLRRAARHAFVFYHGAIQIAAALLASYARGWVNAGSAGIRPGPVVRPETIQALAEMDIDASAAFPKPVTDDATEGADIVILLSDIDEPADLTEPADATPSSAHTVRWQLPDLDDANLTEMQAGRDALDRRVLHLLADLLADIATR